jgi:hypothetical protein
MGTRGVYGYRIDGEDKVTYNHYDSYPDVLGARILSYASRMGFQRMREVAQRVVLVDGNETVEKEMIERYKFYADLNVADCRYDSWYCLLRNTQSNLYPYHRNLEHMIDSHEFLADSLFCEWAYIINLDVKSVEVYRGFNKNPEEAGRYAGLQIEKSEGYHGVKLISEVPLLNLKERFIPPITQFLNAHAEIENQKTFSECDA